MNQFDHGKLFVLNNKIKNEKIPKDEDALDYSKKENYLIKNILNISSYDLIFFYGTGVTNSTNEDGTADICEEMKTTGSTNYLTQGSSLSAVKSNKNNRYVANVFVPLYRQLSLEYELNAIDSHNDLLKELKNKIPYVDLKAFLDFYFTHINKDGKTPFVIAGHSQGSGALQVVLDNYFINGGHKKYLKNCIAMYSTGFGVSKKWFDALDKTLNNKEIFHFAKGNDDINCLISWNTEGPNPNGENGLLSDDEYDTYVINPLNWKTDETYAKREDNLGVLIKNPNYEANNIFMPKYIISHNYDDLFDAFIDLKRGSIIAQKPNSGTYVNMPPQGPIWGGVSYHCSDMPAFFINVSVNLGDRLDKFYKK